MKRRRRHDPCMFRWLCLLFVALLGFVPSGGAAEVLAKLSGCTLVRTDWADGDSFLVRTDEGKEQTIRLYGADCLEWHVNDETDARRLREQRRYFGISLAGGSALASIEASKGFGKLAAQRVAALLVQPFTVHTAFADARGDGKHPRIYGFVTLSDGRDLATVLVSEGLARAFGVYRTTPDGRAIDAYRSELRDVELLAAKLSKGVWAKTDWEKLPVERREQRAEEADLGLAAGKSKEETKLILDPNTAARDDLQKLPGVGEVTANHIIEERPFKTVDDLGRVPGIGKKTLEKLRPHLKIGPAGL